MRLFTLPRYFFGSRTAIEEIATTPTAVWLGMLFVVSAGFAREYDGQDLWHEPWHVLVPLCVSAVTSFLLFALAVIALRPRLSVGYFRAYWSFLGLYWATAPLAWVYAVPVERFLSAVEAVQANLCLLALVSLWRVALMTRVVSVLFRVNVGTGFGVVMFFADSVAVGALMWQSLSVIAAMSGARFTEDQLLLRDASNSVLCLGVATWPLWAVAFACIALGKRSAEFAMPAMPRRGSAVSWPLWMLAAASLFVWAFVLPITQPEQQLRRRAEDAVRSGRLVEAMRLMSEHQRSDFPPHWDPPPKPELGDRKPGALEIAEALVEAHAAPWVRQVYLAKLQRVLDLPVATLALSEMLRRQGVDRFGEALRQLPEGPDFLERNRQVFEGLRQIADEIEKSGEREGEP